MSTLILMLAPSVPILSLPSILLACRFFSTSTWPMSYEREIREAHTQEERDYAMDDAEDAVYGDAAISLQHFETLKALYERLEKLG